MVRDTRLPVVVDGITRQGSRNLGVALVCASGGELPEFKAGAHIDVLLKDGLIRQYSIASSPSERNFYLICVRRAETSRGGSDHVHSILRVGDRLQISPPRNLFELRPAGKYVLLAGGIGITPLLSMAEVLDEQNKPFELHYYVKLREDAAFSARLCKGFRSGQIQIHSSEEGLSPQSFLPQLLYNPDEDPELYLCGPGGFMALARNTAIEHGWVPERIHQETFAPLAQAIPESTDSFEVRLASSDVTFKIQSHESIADVLTGAGVSIPVSCGVGVCGSCLTTVISGVVDHRDSVQSDSEKCASRQSIALCCSRSLSPVLVLDL